MDTSHGDNLIEELLADPVGFSEEGKAYQLLQEYFKGYPLDSLRPLLKHKDLYISSAAVFITSELGKQASELINDIIPLLKSENRSVKYDALESVMVCSSFDNLEKFTQVIDQMGSDDEVIRVLAMFLISNANVNQLSAAIDFYKNDNIDSSKAILEGLILLTETGQSEYDQILSMLQSSNKISRKFGAIAAKRFKDKFPDLIKLVEKNSDQDLVQFADRVRD